MTKENKTRVGCANARLFLLGENLDWMNGQCVTTSVPGMHTVVEAEFPSPVDRVTFIENKPEEISSERRLTQAQREFGDRLCNCSLASWRRINGNLPPTRLEVRSNVMLEGGLASSSSLCAATIKALSAVKKRTETVQEVAAAAFIAERELAGIPCGRLDQVAVQIEGCTLFDFRKEEIDAVRLVVPGDIFFLVVSTGVSESFIQIGEKMYLEWKNQSLKITRFFNETLALAKEFVDRSRCSQLDATSLGTLLTRAQESANHFHGAANQRVEEILQICSRYGSLGGKCSGMRRSGGVAFCVFDGPIQKKLIEELELLGFSDTHQFEWQNA